MGARCTAVNRCITINCLTVQRFHTFLEKMLHIMKKNILHKFPLLHGCFFTIFHIFQFLCQQFSIENFCFKVQDQILPVFKFVYKNSY